MIRLFLLAIVFIIPSYGHAFDIKELPNYKGVAIKEMSMTDSLHVNNKSKNAQIKGTRSLERLLGTVHTNYLVQYVYLGDKTLEEGGYAKWYYHYHPSGHGRGAGRINYEQNSVMKSAHAGDVAVVAKKSDKEILILIIEQNNPAVDEVYKIFGIKHPDARPDNPVVSPALWNRLTSSVKSSDQTDASEKSSKSKKNKQKYSIDNLPPEPVVSLENMQKNRWIRIYFTPSTDCEDNIINQIDDAKKKIDLAVYSITNNKIVGSLVRAQKRGVKIRVVTDRLQATGKKSLVDNLRDEGLVVRENLKHKIEHNKFAVFDGKYIVTGSYNWTAAATNSNSENCVFFEQPAKEFSNRFNYLWTLYEK